MLSGKKHSEEDSRLLRELSTGSQDAFKALYDKYWSDVLDDAFKRLQDIDQAKDVVQDVFAYLWAKAGKLQIKNLPAWLTTVTKYQVFGVFKRQQKFVSPDEMLTELRDAGDNPDARLLREELAKAYEALIHALPGQQRIIFKMRYQEELSPDEIATRLSLSSKTVRNHLGRALLKLKKAFFIFMALLVIHFIYF